MKIRKALLAENNETITPKEYERRSKEWRDKKELRCSCGAKLSFVTGHIRENEVWINPFFRINKLSSHLETCEYKVSNQLKRIAKTKPECLPFMDGKYNFSLKIIYFSKGKDDNIKSAESYSQTSCSISCKDSSFDNYIQTLYEILQLREMLEEEDLSKELSLSYYGKKIKWNCFFFDYETLGNALDLVKSWKKGQEYPLCFEGYVKWIIKPKFSTLFLYGKEKDCKKPALNLSFPNKDTTSLIKKYPKGTKILVYGKVDLIDNPSSDFNNLKMIIFDEKQILKVEE